MNRRLLPVFAMVFLSAAACASPAVDGEAQGESQAAISGAFPVGTRLMVTATVNLRSQPSLSASVVEVIPSGSQVQSASASPRAGWYGITFEGKTGWVSGSYLSKATVASGASGTYDRTAVYDLVVGRGIGGGAASDLLDSGKTTQDLVNAVGWLATHSPPDWGFSVMNTGHHYDPEAHTGGYAIDFFATNAADDLRFLDLVNQDPYVKEVGVAGEYTALRGAITSGGKCSFIDSGGTHVHASVRRYYC